MATNDRLGSEASGPENNQPCDPTLELSDTRGPGELPPGAQADASSVVAEADATLTHAPGSHVRAPMVPATVANRRSDTSRQDRATAAPPAAGENDFGNYELLEEIARGGMGVVFKARQKQLNRIVALKMILSGEFAGADEIQRFRTEAEAAANLQHAGIVPIYEVGEHQGRHFFSMGYVEGETLSNLLEEGPLASREAAHLVAQVADAIAYAHEHGVVHRDLKPGNILLDRERRPHVTDFGLAKRTNADSALTGTGQILGTPSYMAPEQAAARMEAVGPRSDVYALGAVLYCLLTGRPPFRAANVMDTVLQVLQQEPVPPRQLNSTVDRDLETICLKCLEKEPHKRYASAHELREELERFLRGEAIQARPIGRLARGWRWCKRNPAVASLAAAVLASLVVGAVVSCYFAVESSRRASAEETARRFAESRERDAREAAEGERRARQEADAAREAARREQKRAEWAAFTSQIALSEREWELGHAPAAFRILDDTRPELRGWEHAYLTQLYHRDRLWTGTCNGSAYAGQVVRNPDGNRFATVTRAELAVWDRATWKAVLRAPLSVAQTPVIAFSADGQSLFLGDGIRSEAKTGKIVEWDAQAGKPKREFPPLPAPVERLHVHPTSPLILAGCANGRTYWVDIPSGAVQRDVATHRTYSSSSALSPDGGLLATADWYGPVRFWNALTGEPVRRSETVSDVWPMVNGGMAFSPDGKTLALVGVGILLWDVNTGKLKRSLTDETSLTTGVQWTEEGSQLVTVSEDRTVSLWDPKKGRRHKRFQGHLTPVYGLCVIDGALVSLDVSGVVIAWPANPTSDPRIVRAEGQAWLDEVAFCHSGVALASVQGGGGGQLLTIWDLHSGAVAQVGRGHTDYITGLVTYRDGRMAFTSSEDGTARRWDLTTGACTAVLAGHSGYVTGVACSPSGDWAATAGQDGKVHVWNPDTQTTQTTLLTRAVPASEIAATPDGHLLAASYQDGEIFVWETESWSQVAKLTHGRGSANRIPIVAVALTPDGKSLISGGSDMRLTVWDLASRKQRWSRQIAPYPVLSIKLLPGGAQFVTAGGAWATPGAVKVWNIATGENTMTLQGTGREFRAVAVNPYDGGLAACSHDGVIALWGNRVHSLALDETGAPEEQRRLAWRYQRALESHAHQDREQALAHLDFVIGHAPGSVGALGRKVELLVELDLPAEALQTFDAAVSQPDISGAHRWAVMRALDKLAGVESITNDLAAPAKSLCAHPQEAVRLETLRALQRWPELATAVSEAIVARLEDNRQAVAREAGKLLANRLEQEGGDAWKSHASNLPPTARAILEEAQTGLRAERLRERIALLERQKKWKEAAAEYEQWVLLEPDNVHAWTRLGEILARYRIDVERASQAYERLVQLDPQEIWHWHRRMLLLGYLKQSAAHGELRRRQWERFHASEDNAVLRILIADAMALPLPPEEASRYVKLAEEISFDHADEWKRLYRGIVRYRAGASDQAVADLGSLVQATGNYAQASLAFPFLALAHYEAGDHDAARSALRTAENLLFRIDQTDDLGTAWQNTYYALAAYREALGKMGSDREAEMAPVAELTDADSRLWLRRLLLASRVFLAGQEQAAAARAFAQAQEIVDHLVSHSPTPASLYNAACVLSRRAGAAPRSDEAASYQQRALQLLRQAVTAGFYDAPQMHADRDLAALREHPEFAKIVELAAAWKAVLVDGSFENPAQGAWSARSYRENKQACAVVDESPRAGKLSLRIRSDEPDDAGMYQKVRVKPGAKYRLTGWVKTQGVLNAEGKDAGALLSILQGFERSDSVLGTQDWTQVTLDFDAGDRQEVEIGVRLGHFSNLVTGTAWFDDLRLVELGGAEE